MIMYTSIVPAAATAINDDAQVVGFRMNNMDPFIKTQWNELSNNKTT